MDFGTKIIKINQIWLNLGYMAVLKYSLQIYLQWTIEITHQLRQVQ
jgi:hypothetical protein